jgi:large subunit ribosomal protein LP1
MSSQPVDKLTPAEKSQLACTYATLILHDENSDINADKIAKLVAAAGVNVEAYWPKLIAKALQGRSVSDFFGGNDTASTAAPPTTAPVKEEKKK